MLSSPSLVQIGGKTQDASFPCLFWLLVYFLFRFVSVYKYVSLFVFFLNSSFSSWLLSAYSPSMCRDPFLVMSHIARGGALRDVQRVTEAMPCVASVCQGMQGVERKWRRGKRNLFFFICCSRSNFCAKKLAVQRSFFVHNIWRSFNIRVVGADLKESGLRVRNNAEGCSETTLQKRAEKTRKNGCCKVWWYIHGNATALWTSGTVSRCHV